ncbi:MAG: DUF2793 domain-containing protein [Sphingobium sp.]|nr:DUF2793 domain-containing protein [Sphingobium sp.]
MTMIQSDRLALPLLAAGQAEKELAHNEALLRLDIVTQSAVESADLNTPPPTPASGRCWIVAAGASGGWAGRAGAIAGWTDNGWRFVQPAPGWRVWVADRNHAMRYDGTGWIDEDARSGGYFVAGIQVLAAQQAAIANPAGGATSDSEARVAITSILAALRAHGLIAT